MVAMTSPEQHGELILLGTSTSVGVPMIGCDCLVCTSTNPKNHRTRTGVAVQTSNGTFLIDTPPELRLQLVREKISLVHAAVFTHSHADHIFGLDDLRICGYRLKGPVALYCEEPTEQQIRQSFNYAFVERDLKAHNFARPNLEFERIGLDPFEVLGQMVTPIRLLHGRLPVLGFRLGDVAFCTDVNQIPDESWPLLEGLDVLILDALRDEPHPTHFGIEEALEVVERVKPRRTFFTHVSHTLEYDATNARLPDGVELAYDGLRIPF
jgi:phosphoribosyl 1,2-cyclic phosphate phosphodiesterase